MPHQIARPRPNVAITQPIMEKAAANAARERNVAHARIVARHADMVANVGNERELVFFQLDVDDVGIV